MKEKLVKYLINELCYAYCDNCKYNDYEKYGDNYCEECHRKYQNWALAEHTAKELIDYIDRQYYEIINYLVKWLEDEHMGLDNEVRENLKEKFNYEI